MMSLLQSGKVDLGLIGGAADIATLAGRCIIIMNHERHCFVPKVRLYHLPWTWKPKELARPDSSSRPRAEPRHY